MSFQMQISKVEKLKVPALDNNRRLILSRFENRGKLNFRWIFRNMLISKAALYNLFLILSVPDAILT